MQLKVTNNFSINKKTTFEDDFEYEGDNEELDKDTLIIGGIEVKIKKAKQKHGSTSREKKEHGYSVARHRKKCDCLGTEHSVLTNCLGCGRIICSVENIGPCFFCGEMISKDDIMKQQQPQNPSTATSGSGNTSVTSQQTDEDLSMMQKAAVDHKNKLIEMDRNGQQRTTVIDDQTDYYESDRNMWLSEEEKKERKEKEEKLRKLKSDIHQKQTFTIDFAGRKIYEDSLAKTKMEIQSVLNDLQNPITSSLVEKKKLTMIRKKICSFSYSLFFIFVDNSRI